MYTRAFVAAGLLLLAPTAGRAASITFLGAAPTTGTIYYAGGTSPLEGSDVSLDLVVGTNTPANGGAAALCIGCVLNFATGDFLAGDASAYVFGDGGSFTITGGVDLTGDGLLGDAGDIDPGTSLLSGVFVGQQYVLVSGPSFSGLQLSAGLATVHAALGAYYGLGAFTGDVLLLAQFAGVGQAPGPFVSTSIDGVIVTAPEPASLALFGLAALGLAVRRRMRA